MAAMPRSPLAGVARGFRRCHRSLGLGGLVQVIVVRQTGSPQYRANGYPPLLGEHMLEQQQADHEAALDARPRLVAVERRDLSVDPRPVDLAPICTSSCFMLMIWSSLARNRSPSPVASCFFDRIV
jgi:hypothetical protein